MALFVILASMARLPLWLVILVVFPDVLIVGGSLLYDTLTNTLRMEPLDIRKANTPARILLVAPVPVDLGFGLFAPDVTRVAVYVVAVLTLASGAACVWTWGRRAVVHEQDS